MSSADDPPDLIAHELVTNDGSPVRCYPENGTITVPTEPYRSGTPPTVDVPVPYFDAVIDRVDVVDGGLNVAGFGGLHLPASEWERTGLGRHWNADDAAVGEPFSNTSRRLEVWASREETFYETDPEDWSFEHLSPVPAESPLIEAWESHDDEGPDRPPVPLSAPKLTLYVLHADDSESWTHGFDRLDVGRIDGIELLDDLEEWPTEPDVESPDIDLSPPPRHPDIEYDDLEPLPQTDDVLAAVQTINRHAKRFGTEADHAYQIGDGARARVYSLQKKALYRTKTIAVHRLAKASPAQTQIALHDLDGAHEMYCVSFAASYSFHQPIAAVAEELLDAVSTETRETKTIDFEPSAATDDLEYSLQAALEVLAAYGLDANDSLDATSVEDYDWGCEISTTFDCLQ